MWKNYLLLCFTAFIASHCSSDRNLDEDNKSGNIITIVDTLTKEKNGDIDSLVIIAHKGFWDYSGGVENSLQAFNYAQKLKVHGIEFDVRMSKDSILYVHHDEKIFNSVFSNLSSSELDRIAISKSEKIPRLSSFLDSFDQSSDALLYIDIKTSSDESYNKLFVKKILELLTHYNISAKHKLLINNFSLFKYLKEYNSVYKTVMVLGGNNIYYKLLEYYKVDELAVKYEDFDIYEKEFSKIKTLGMHINLFTINNLDDIRRFHKNKLITGIITDRPDRAMKIIKK